VAGYFENPDGTSSFASLCVRVGADLRNAFTVPAITDAERVSLIEGMCLGGISDVAPIDLAGAAEIVFEGLDRTRAAGLPVPADATAAIALFERARDPARLAALSIPPAAPPTLAEARSLLDLPVYQSWFFDRGDLAAAGVDMAGASSGKPKAAWLRRALERLAASEARPRLAAMLRHMAAWHALRDEVDKAALCSAAEAEALARFAEGALPRAMLERSIKTWKALEREAAEKGLGDRAVRGRLRLDFFPAIQSPKGRDLAILDFCEVAYLALDTWLSLLPVNQRPRDRDMAAAAFALARLFAGAAFATVQRSFGGLPQAMEEELHAATRVDRGSARTAIRGVLRELGAFVGQVCSGCPVACLNKPKADMTEAFFSPRHPASRGPGRA
jgi:hypothetical protein